MGTNFYHHDDETGERRHIGKSSAGWVFLVRVHTNVGILTLEDWQKQWEKPGTSVKDEYGEKLTPVEMLDWVTNRTFPWVSRSSQQSLTKNNAEVGPNNLLRPRINETTGCVGHGDGTWSYIGRDFS